MLAVVIEQSRLDERFQPCGKKQTFFQVFPSETHNPLEVPSGPAIMTSILPVI